MTQAARSEPRPLVSGSLKEPVVVTSLQLHNQSYDDRTSSGRLTNP